MQQWTLPSPVGTITLACNHDGTHLTGLWIEGQKHHGGQASEAASGRPDAPLFAAAKRWLERYFAGSQPSPSELPLAPAGSAFRREIFAILCEIPYGEVMTYGEIAAKIAASLGRKTMSSQAVGGAVGHNPLAIVIPCHRVVGANGSLTGYAGGIETKMKLLAWEGVDVSRFFVPNRAAVASPPAQGRPARG